MFVLKKRRVAINGTKWWMRLTLAVSLAAFLNGVFANAAHASQDACRPVKVCAPVRDVAPLPPACKPVRVVKSVAPLPPACKPVRTIGPVHETVRVLALPVRVVHAVHLALASGHVRRRGVVEKETVVPQPATAPAGTTPAATPTTPLPPPPDTKA
jgi:hypothetical protein